MNLDFKDEVLTECLNDIISALLPHDNYESDNFSILYPALKTALDSKSVKGLYYAFYCVFDKYVSVSASFPLGTFPIKITRERFANAMENNLPDFILEPQMDVQRLMAEEGKFADISVQTSQQEIMGVIYSKVMALYDDCFQLARSYEDATSRLVDLRDVIKANLIETSMGSQRVIMSTGLKRGRKHYRGPSGWLEYVQDVAREISELDRSDDNDLVCNSLDNMLSLDEERERMRTPLGCYGIPQLDDFTPMLQHRLVVLTARENTGKTQVIKHLIATLIRNNVKVMFACGESTPSTMQSEIVCSYIYQEYGLYFQPQHISGPGYEALAPADRQVVDTAKARVALSGLVVSVNARYDTIESKITHYYHQGYRAFFIDHTLSLRGRDGKKEADLVTSLSLICRDLKRQYPIYICMASQASTALKEQLQRGQSLDIQSSPTAHSSTPSTEADELFILHDNDFLKAQGLLGLTVYKRRNGVKPDTIYLKKHFDVSAYEYDPKYQGVDSIDSSTLDGMVAAIDRDEDDDFDDGNMEIDF